MFKIVDNGVSIIVGCSASGQFFIVERMIDAKCFEFIIRVRVIEEEWSSYWEQRMDGIVMAKCFDRNRKFFGKAECIGMWL